MDYVPSIPSVGPVRPNSILPFETDQPAKGPDTFGEMLKGAVNKVDALEKDADDKMLKLSTGEVQDIHEVMLAAEKADLSLQLTVEIRDRVIEAYQTILRMAM